MYSLELPHWGNSNEYTQHTIISLKMEKTFLDYFHLPFDLAQWLTRSGSNYSCLEQISMVPKMFEPLKFDCTFFFVYVCRAVKGLFIVKKCPTRDLLVILTQYRNFSCDIVPCKVKIEVLRDILFSRQNVLLDCIANYLTEAIPVSTYNQKNC